MKKTYRKPTMVVVTIGMQSVICTSVVLTSDSQDNGSALSPEFNWDGELTY